VQSQEVKAREKETKMAQDAQRLVRSGRRRGLLAYTEDLGTSLGGGGTV
jgi:hypothetical protein